MLKCNLCGSTQTESLYKLNNIDIITTREVFKIDVDNVICKNCGLVFQDSAPNKEKLASFYKHQYRVSESGEIIRQQQKEYLEKYLPENKHNQKRRILDIGSFEGYFLHLFKADGWEAVGVEPSDESAEICTERYGIKVYNEMFEHVAFAEKEFDVIAIRHVLEHVDDAFRTIMLMKKYLKDDGLIFIEVPNIEKFDERDIADAYSFQHIYHFSINTLKNYFNRCGLEIIDGDTDLPYASMRFLCKKGKSSAIENYYEETKNLVLIYKKKREANLADMRRLLAEKNKKWQQKNARIYIYGAGLHTALLFQHVINAAEFNIIGLIDQEQQKEGKEFFGYRTYHTGKLEDLLTAEDVVIISSYAFQEVIYENLKPLADKGTEIVRLYQEIYSYDTL